MVSRTEFNGASNGGIGDGIWRGGVNLFWYFMFEAFFCNRILLRFFWRRRRVVTIARFCAVLSFIKCNPFQLFIALLMSREIRSFAGIDLLWDLFHDISSHHLSCKNLISHERSHERCTVTYLLSWDLISHERCHLAWNLSDEISFLAKSHLSIDLVLYWDHISIEIISLSRSHLSLDLISLDISWEKQDLLQDIIFHLSWDVSREILSLVRSTS